MRLRLVRLCTVIGLALATLAVAGPASAHNVLLHTDPADGSQVAALPSTVSLTFNLPALNIGSLMEIIGPAGNVALGKPTLIDENVNQAVKPGSPGGAYKVLWRVTSADGHPISGEFTFTATAGNGGTTSTLPATASPAAITPTTASASSSTSSSTSSSGSVSPALWALIGIAVLAAAAGLLLAARRGGARG